MDCPRCGGTLDAYTLRGSRAVSCTRCRWTGTEAALADVEEAGPTLSWDEVIDRASGQGGHVDRRRADLPPVATGESADSGGEPTPHVERVPEGAAGNLETIDGIQTSEAERLRAAGVETMEELAAADRADLAEETGLPIGRIRTFVRRASIQDVTDEPETE
jgi:hypothetical protein